jgi:hypothetical protein
MLVGCATRVDLREWVWSRPSDVLNIAYVAIRYAESAGSPRAYRADCGCDDERTRNSAMTDRWRIDVLWSKPDAPKGPPVDLCHDMPPCAACPPGPYVMLAGVRVPPQEATTIQRADIDLSVRTLI